MSGGDGHEQLLGQDGAEGDGVLAELQCQGAIGSLGRHARIGRAIQVMVRNQPVEAETVETPFYKRAK